MLALRQERVEELLHAGRDLEQMNLALLHGRRLQLLIVTLHKGT